MGAAGTRTPAAAAFLALCRKLSTSFSKIVALCPLPCFACEAAGCPTERAILQGASVRVRVPSQATCKSLAWNAKPKRLPASERNIRFLFELPQEFRRAGRMQRKPRSPGSLSRLNRCISGRVVDVVTSAKASSSRRRANARRWCHLVSVSPSSAYASKDAFSCVFHL